ncbi:ATP synthase mitochondrial F1 complex assembly factor 2 [Sphingobium sp. SYK-6]|uniref:ATP12 family chaperone protein n=1 Tax=Sphingobium sp. (strain NBRC 103272 / SYK-6) TaxID=627192 RepID=UPI0002277A0B|nr:ATP12 family protein [Sphingobium sp. SYK-6]BAK68119.1 ATP synthase mitochondrial F1 complex assembly factor 2 [Sphingobium sp. SYK-6]
MKRFWKEAQAVADGEGWAIRLDGRPVRTPARALLVVPHAAMAQAIAAEWDAQGEEIDPRTMPMTGFANATIDRVLTGPGAFRGQVAAYAESDLLCYRADEPEALVARQNDVWEPLLDWARGRFGIAFAVTAGIVPVDQPARTLAALRGAVEALDPWLLAGAATMTQLGGTLVGTLALLHGATEAEALFDAASLDEHWQAEQWGEDAEAAARLAERRTAFLDAARWCALASAR